MTYALIRRFLVAMSFRDPHSLLRHKCCDQGGHAPSCFIIPFEHNQSTRPLKLPQIKIATEPPSYLMKASTNTMLTMPCQSPFSYSRWNCDIIDISCRGVPWQEGDDVAQLIVRNVDPEVVHRLKLRAAQHGRSMEAEHREILRQALLTSEPGVPLKALLLAMPPVGDDVDFARLPDHGREVEL